MIIEMIQLLAGCILTQSSHEQLTYTHMGLQFGLMKSNSMDDGVAVEPGKKYEGPGKA